MSATWVIESVPLKLDKKGYCRHGILGVGWEQKWCYRCYLNYKARKRSEAKKLKPLHDVGE